MMIRVRPRALEGVVRVLLTSCAPCVPGQCLGVCLLHYRRCCVASFRISVLVFVVALVVWTARSCGPKRGSMALVWPGSGSVLVPVPGRVPFVLSMRGEWP